MPDKSLINLGDISKPATVLIKKISGRLCPLEAAVW